MFVFLEIMVICVLLVCYDFYYVIVLNYGFNFCLGYFSCSFVSMLNVFVMIDCLSFDIKFRGC